MLTIDKVNATNLTCDMFAKTNLAAPATIGFFLLKVEQQ